MDIKIHCAYDDLVDVHLLQPNPKNPNKHTKEQIDLLSKIMKKTGIRAPITVSKRTGFITKGHGRLEAAKQALIEKYPVDYQEYENEAQEYADMVADNKIAELAKTDLSMVNAEVMDLGPDFDIELLGIPDFVIEPVEKYDSEKDDDVPDKVPAKTVLGDLYELGNHRLLCGDSTSVDAVDLLMAGQKADMVFTDPPYGYSYESNRQKVHKELKNDDKILDFMPMAYSAMAENSTIYIFGAHQTIDKWKPVFCDAFKYKNLIVWQKNNWSMGSLKDSFAGQHELILFGVKGKVNIIGKRDSDIWKFDREPPKDHPTMKPVDLIEFALSKFQSGRVLDLFGGSGSTLIACEKTNRKCFMMELDPHYCDVIVQRYVNYTGNAMIKVNGQEVDWREYATLG